MLIYWNFLIRRGLSAYNIIAASGSNTPKCNSIAKTTIWAAAAPSQVYTYAVLLYVRVERWVRQYCYYIPLPCRPGWFRQGSVESAQCLSCQARFATFELVQSGCEAGEELGWPSCRYGSSRAREPHRYVHTLYAVNKLNRPTCLVTLAVCRHGAEFGIQDWCRTHRTKYRWHVV